MICPRAVLLLMVVLVVVVAGGYPGDGAAQPRVSITNSCGFPVWITELPNTGFPIIPSDNPHPASKLNSGQTANYTIPANGWEGQFRPKTGCDDQGNNCTSGASLPPCPPDGCEPPGETKIEFFYGPLPSDKRPYYDITLVDGYSLAATITPSTGGGRCTPTSCALALAACPTDDYVDSAIVWDKKGASRILPLPSSDTRSEAHAINKKGLIVGDSGPGGDTDDTAAMWNHETKRLSPLGGDTASEAFDINDGGEAAGRSLGAAGYTALFWNKDGHPKALPPLHGDTESQAFGINGAGNVAGISIGAHGYTAVVWKACKAR